jgi:Spy/CpxP family protein refolding chaperone
MKTFIIILIVAVTLLGITGVVFAKKNGGFCHNPNGKMDWIVDRMSKRLELDETQRVNLETLRDQLLTIRDSFRKDREQHQAAIGEMLAAPQLDRALAESMLTEKQQRFSEHGQSLINAFADFSDSLHPEQREKLAQTLQDFPFRHGSGFGHSRGPM